jgi:hypothetical protein
MDESVPDRAGRVHLFDSHGEGGEVVHSGLFNPFWTHETATRIETAHRNSSRPDQRGIERNVIGFNGQKGEAVLNAEAGPNGDAGSSDYSGASGDAGSNDFNGAGNDSGSDQFSGAGGDSGADGTSGSSKTLWFPVAQLASLREGANRGPVVDPCVPEGIIRAGEVVTYVASNSTLSGVYRLQLPSGRAADLPTLVLLDSCFGTPEVANSLLAAADSRDRTIVTLTSRDPIHIGLVQYGSFGVGDYLALPIVLAEGFGDASSQFREPAQAITKHLSQDGLDRSPLSYWGIDKIKERSCKLQVQVVHSRSAVVSLDR